MFVSIEFLLVLTESWFVQIEQLLDGLRHTNGMKQCKYSRYVIIDSFS